MLNRKGRTAKTFITISDELLSPYIIKVDEDNYTVALESKPEAGLHYCTTLPSALDRITRSQMIKSETKSLRGYINEYKNMFNQLKEVISQ